MTPDDVKRIVDTIHERVGRILNPLGILVQHEIKKSGTSVAEFTLKIPGTDKAKPGVYEELIVHLMNYDVQNCLNDAAQLDCLPRAWARICAEWAPSLFDESNVPPTDGVDWRPQETLPEDFYAA